MAERNTGALAPLHTTSVQIDPGGEAQRRKELKFHKARATGLLVLATVAFVLLVAFTDGEGWAGYAEAAAEAAMVGGIADWFAVTALFRHPLRLPIPHTAIVPKRKDEIGQSLGDFVQENFLQPDVLRARLTSTDLAARLGVWLREPGNARRLGDQAGAIVGSAIETLRDDEIQQSVEHYVTKRIADFEPTPLAARAIEFAVEGGHHHAVFDAGLAGVRSVLADNRNVLRKRLAKESPWWVPEPVDDRVFQRIFAAIDSFIDDITSDPDHEFRRNLDVRIDGLVTQLRESPELRDRSHELKAELLAHPAMREWTAGLWANIKEALLLAAADPTSELRVRIHSAAMSLGESLDADPALRAKVNTWIVNAVVGMAAESRSEIADLIASTVEGWDADETSDRIELQVGRDLQYIRINGTVVGGIAGLVIHAIAQLIG